VNFFPPRDFSEWAIDATVPLWIILAVWSIARGMVEVVNMIAEAWRARRG